MAFKFIWQDYSVNRTMLTVELLSAENKQTVYGWFLLIYAKNYLYFR